MPEPEEKMFHLSIWPEIKKGKSALWLLYNQIQCMRYMAYARKMYPYWRYNGTNRVIEYGGGNYLKFISLSGGRPEYLRGLKGNPKVFFRRDHLVTLRPHEFEHWMNTISNMNGRAEPHG
jgi:hypothetical protein